MMAEVAPASFMATSMRISKCPFGIHQFHLPLILFLEAEEEVAPQEGPDPTQPVTRKGVLTSFLTGEQMGIPEQDLVSGMISS